jgi:hypothetical protein
LGFIIDIELSYLEKRNNHIQFIKERLLLSGTKIEETKDGIANLQILSPDGQIAAKASIDNYVHPQSINQEEIILMYTSKKESDSDVKGITSEL